MLSLSGSGVNESLALAHAPFTKITPSGTFVTACVLLEKSPPFFVPSCPSAHWQTNDNNDTDQTTTPTKSTNRLRMSLLQSGRQSARFITRKRPARRLRVFAGGVGDLQP